MRLRQAAAAVCILAAVFSMTGCWNYRELETIAMVAGFSIDKGETGSGYHMTFEVLDESGGGGNGGSGSPSALRSTLIESDGDTIFDAVRNALKKSDKKLYFGECKAVILSRQLAFEGITPLLDWINRDSEPRLTENLFVSKEATAADVLRQKSPVNPITSYALEKIITNDPDFLAKTPFMQLYKVNGALGGQGISLVLPALDIGRQQGDTPPELAGTAVFKKDKLLGFLGSEESKYLLFAQDQVGGGVLLVAESSDTPDTTLEIISSKTEITVLSKGGSPKLGIAVKMEAALGETETALDLSSESGIHKLEQDAARTLESRIGKLIHKTQNEYDSDIFGFGNSIYKDEPRYWDEIAPRWDSLFKNLKADISADVKIKNTALAKSNVKAGG